MPTIEGKSNAAMSTCFIRADLSWFYVFFTVASELVDPYSFHVTQMKIMAITLTWLCNKKLQAGLK
jgi:hypothetical protein